MDLNVNSKICEICGKEYFKKETEAVDTFNSRKYCSYKCVFKGQKSKNNWRNFRIDRKKTM